MEQLGTQAGAKERQRRLAQGRQRGVQLKLEGIITDEQSASTSVGSGAWTSE